MNWSCCPDVERRPGVLSGDWVVKGSRVPADAVVGNLRDGYSPREIVRDIFEGLDIESVRRIARFAGQDASHPA